MDMVTLIVRFVIGYWIGSIITIVIKLLDGPLVFGVICAICAGVINVIRGNIADKAASAEIAARAAEAKRQEESRRAEAKRQAEASTAEARHQEELRQAEAKRQEEARKAEARRQEEASIAEAKSHIKSHSIISDSNTLSFDTESLNWIKEEFFKFFDALKTARVVWLYSLAVRKWQPDSFTDLSLPQGTEWKNDIAFDEIKKTIGEEFGSSVICCTEKAVALMSSGYEDLGEGVSLTNKEFEHVKLFVNMFQMGRRMNISIYTLFAPLPNTDAEQMKSLVITLKDNQSRKIAAFESLTISVVLKAILAAKEKISGSGVEY